MAEPTKQPVRAAEPVRHEEAISEQGRLGGVPGTTGALVGGNESEALVYRPLSIWAVAASKEGGAVKESTRHVTLRLPRG